MYNKKPVRLIRVREEFIKECLDPIIENEETRGRDNTSYAAASEILRKRIKLAGGLKSK